MKKLLAILLVMGMLAAMLAGCSGSTSSDKDDKDDEAGKTESGFAFEETVVYDKDGIKVTFKGVEDDAVSLSVENGTEKDIILSGSDFVVNGVTMSVFMYMDVAAGKTANEKVDLDETSMEAAGIEKVATLACYSAGIVDDEEYEYIDQFTFELTAKGGEDFEQELDKAGEVIYEGNDILVIARGIEETILGEYLSLLVINSSGKDIVVSADDFSADGVMIDGWMYDTVYAGTARYAELSFYDSEGDEIENVGDLSFTLEFIDHESYGTIDTSEEITVTIG